MAQARPFRVFWLRPLANKIYDSTGITRIQIGQAAATLVDYLSRNEILFTVICSHPSLLSQSRLRYFFGNETVTTRDSYYALRTHAFTVCVPISKKRSHRKTNDESRASIRTLGWTLVSTFNGFECYQPDRSWSKNTMFGQLNFQPARFRRLSFYKCIIVLSI